MLPEIGHFCLILSLCLAILQVGLFAFKPYSVRALALGQIFFVVVAFAILSLGLLTDDFSVVYVVQNSNSSLPWYYKLTALWAAHEGSLLLWVLILNGWIMAVLLASRNNWLIVFANKVLLVLGLINTGFLILLLKSSNPFLRIMFDAPLDGADLNPLLQDFGMIIHPPILYMGYVGTVVGFAFAIAALWDGKLDKDWAMLLRPWGLCSWVFLTIGIVLGSWWAYYELGWGGWWFWDPVENASFMPWLTATALLHCLVVAAREGRFLNLAVFLSIVTFALSLLGTFLVRSGIISSVHAFVTDAARGVYILQFLAIVIGGGLVLYAWRGPTLNLPVLPKLNFLSTTTAILLNNILLLIAAGTVLLGTLYPLIYDVLFAQKISVGYPYFNAVFVPIMLVMFAVLLPAVTPSKKYLLVSIVISLIVAVLFLNLYFSLIKFNAVLGLFFAVAIILNTIRKNQLAMSIAHVGLAVSIIGVSLTPAYQIEKDLRVRVGESVKIAGYDIKFNGVHIIDGPNYLAYQGEFVVDDTKILYPEKRLYLAQELPMTETAISPGLLADIYIALGQQLQTNIWSARIYYKPFVRWIWAGGLLMALGGLFGLARSKKNNAF